MTPVTDLVAATVYLGDPDWFVPALGVVEMIVGIGLIVCRAIRVVLILFVAQMAGTFMVLIVMPEMAFEGGNVLELTVEGEFVIKNLVLLIAGLVVGSTVGSDEEMTQPGSATSSADHCGTWTARLEDGSYIHHHWLPVLTHRETPSGRPLAGVGPTGTFCP